MTTNQPAHDDLDAAALNRETVAAHPTDGGSSLSAGEVLSGRAVRPDGTAPGADGPVGEDAEPPRPRDRTPDATAEPETPATPSEHDDDLSVGEVVQQALDFFGDDDDGNSPASDADAPAPG